MRRISTISVVTAGVSLFVGLAGAETWNPNVGMYGKLNQRTLGIPEADTACVPTAVANSLKFLENKYPAFYGGKLMYDPANMVPLTIGDTAKQLVIDMNTSPPAGGGGNQPPYYDPNQHGLPYPDPGLPGQSGGGTTLPNFAKGKDKFFADRGFNTMQLLKGRVQEPQPGDVYPAWMQLGGWITAQELGMELYAGKDVELTVQWELFKNGAWNVLPGGHGVTLTGFDYNDGNGNQTWETNEALTGLHLIDPWGPTTGAPPMENAPAGGGALSMIGNQLYLTWGFGAAAPPLGGGMYRGRVDCWISEMPEPSSLILVASGALAAFRRRQSV